MRRTLVFVIAIALVSMFAPATQASTPTCDGHPATIVGTDGNDTLTGTSGDDVIVGKEGNDLLHGDGGSDVICGNAGADRIYGDADPDDLLAGGKGNDSLFGGPDSGDGDRLDGGPGDDLIAGGSSLGDFGDLVLYSDAPRSVDVNLNTGVATGYGTDSLTGIEQVRGSPYGDTIVGGKQFLQGLEGGDGNDYIKLTSNANFVAGGNGNDTIKVTPGVVSDSGLDGGSGDDTFIGSAADDSLYVSDGLYSSDGSGNETVYGRDGNDSINMVDGEPGDIANGQAGVDTCSVDAGDSAVDCES